MAAQSYAHASASSATLCTTHAAALSRHAGFTPQLAAAYEMANEDEQRFEVVFVSSDESAQAQHRQPLGRLLVHGPCMARAWRHRPPAVHGSYGCTYHCRRRRGTWRRCTVTGCACPSTAHCAMPSSSSEPSLQ